MSQEKPTYQIMPPSPCLTPRCQEWGWPCLSCPWTRVGCVLGAAKAGDTLTSFSTSMGHTCIREQKQHIPVPLRAAASHLAAWRVAVWDTSWMFPPAPTIVSMFNTSLRFTNNPLLSPTADPAGRAAPDPFVSQHHPRWISNTSPGPDSTGAQG